jgi:hypothetical protein
VFYKHLKLRYVIIIFFIIPNLAAGENINNFNKVVFDEKNVEIIRKHFASYPDQDRIMWKPYHGNLERFEFIIPREAFFTALRFQDNSDLYYLSKVNDNGLSLSDNANANVKLKINPDNFNLSFSKRFFHNLSFGSQIIYNDDYSIGGNISYDRIIRNSVLINIKGILHNDQFSKLEIGSVFLTNNEQAEIFYQFSVSDYGNKKTLNIGKTWFEVSELYDFTSSLDVNKDSVDLSIYTEIEYENNVFNFGIKRLQKWDESVLHFGYLRNFNIKNNIEYALKIQNIDKLNTKFKSLKKFRFIELPRIWKNKLSLKYN